MTAHAAVGVDDNLATREARVAHGATDDETTRGIHIDIHVACSLQAFSGKHRVNHMLDKRGLELVMLNALVVLSGNEHLLDGFGLAIDIADRNLGFAVRAKERKRTVLANLGQALREAMRQINGHRHERARFVAGVAEHHALVARAGFVFLIGGFAVLGLPAFIDALGDIGALAVNGVDYAAGVAVEAILCAVVADGTNNVAHDGVNVNIGLRANFARHEHRARRGDGFARAANLRHVGRLAARRNVAGFFELDFFSENRVQNGIGNLVAQLVGMALGHRLGREQVGSILVGHSEFLSSSLLAGPPWVLPPVGTGIDEPTLFPGS